MFRFYSDRLRTKEKLGKGRFGKVFPYQKNPQDLKWVVKRIRADDPDGLITCLPEIVLGFSCDHPCVVPVKGYFIEKESNNELFNIYIKLPRMKRTLLDEFKERKGNTNPYSDEEISRYFYSLACGLEYLHSKKIYHGDIKHDNLLLDDKGALKIGDIGIAKHVEEEDSYQTLTGQSGTYQYSAPEVMDSNRKDKKKSVLEKADVWSLGTVMLELCVLDLRLLNSLTPQEQLKNQVEELLGGLTYHHALIALIKRTLSPDPAERPTLEEIKAELEKDFAQNLDQDLLKMANSHKLSMEAKYQTEIVALNQQIKEILGQSEIEKDQFKEAISRLELNLAQQKQHLDESQLEKERLKETISRLELNLFEQKQQHENKFRLEKDQFNEVKSQLELSLSQQKQQYEDQIKTLIKRNTAELLEKDKINKNLQAKTQEQIQPAPKKESPRSFSGSLFSIFKGLIKQLIYSFLLMTLMLILIAHLIPYQRPQAQ